MNKIQEIFDRIYALRGRYNVSINEIKDATGITKPTLYRLFQERKCTVANLAKVLDFLESKEGTNE